MPVEKPVVESRKNRDSALTCAVGSFVGRREGNG